MLRQPTGLDGDRFFSTAPEYLLSVEQSVDDKNDGTHQNSGTSSLDESGSGKKWINQSLGDGTGHQESEAHSSQDDILPPFQRHSHEPLGEGGESEHGQHRREKHPEGIQGTLDLIKQQVGIEHEDERQDSRSDVISEALDAGFNRIGFRDGRRRVGGQPNRGRIIGQDAEEEHEQMRRDQRENHVVRRTKSHDDRSRQSRHDDVGGGCRQPHTQQKTGYGREDQNEEKPATGEMVDRLGDDAPEAECHHTNDDAGRGNRDADAHHVLSPGHQRAPYLLSGFHQRRRPAGSDAALSFTCFPEIFQGNKNGQGDDGVERRLVGRGSEHHQLNDKEHQGNQEMDTPQESREESGKLFLFQTSDAEFAGLKMHDIEQRDIADDGRNECRPDHLYIWDIHGFGDNERRRTHDGRHQLPVGGDRHLDGTGLVIRISHLLHQRDGEGAGCHRIGDTRTGNHTGESAGQNRRLGRTSRETVP
jgi:hypothetical protein